MEGLKQASPAGGGLEGAVLVSICIPAYKEPEFLARSLQSILQQDHKNIEVIISDDTPDDSVQLIAEKLASLLSIHYQHNHIPLGSPANWNAALDKAQGELVMLLHHDDWLNNIQSISNCVSVFKNNPSASVVFERGVTADRSLTYVKPTFAEDYYETFYKNPLKLLVNNVIGPPSNIMMLNTVKQRYNASYKWLVDIEFYIRLLLAGNLFVYTDVPIVSVGIHKGQMSNFCQENGDIILKENILFAQQHLQQPPTDIEVYNHYWRLLRNNGIRSLNDLASKGFAQQEVPTFIIRQIKLQSLFPKAILRGAVSRLVMTVAYLFK